MLQTSTIFLQRTLMRCINSVSNHHLPAYHIDVLALGVLTAICSFMIWMFLDYSFYATGAPGVPDTPLPKARLSSARTYQAPQASLSPHREELGLQSARSVILTSIYEEQRRVADPYLAQDINVVFKGQEYRIKRTMNVTMTAYSSTPDQTDSTPFITASNTRVRWGTVAANFLPFQTKVRIPQMFGDKVFVVEDRMNKRYWHRVDVWMPTRQEAIHFGLRTLRVEILEEAPSNTEQIQGILTLE